MWMCELVCMYVCLFHLSLSPGNPQSPPQAIGLSTSKILSAFPMLFLTSLWGWATNGWSCSSNTYYEPDAEKQLYMIL